jgi:hypothetical protein
MVRRWLAGVVFVLGCQPTVRSRAEVAYAEGNFLRAVELYDQILDKKPGDGDAHVERARARNAAFGAIVVAAHTARIRGNFEAALGELRRFFELRRDWKISPPPQLAEAVATELTTATAYVADSVGRALKTGPFAAEVVLARHAPTLDLAGLGERRAELAAPIRSAGLAGCTSLTATASPETPYWTWLVDRACAHWGGPRLVVPALPHQRSVLEVAGAVDGARTDQNAGFRGSVGAAFRASVWYAPSVPGVVRASLDGTIAATLSSRPITLTAEWIESVSYTEDETSQESYQEPYNDTEWYHDQVPYTNSGGTTSYRTEYKSRTVTKYRTAYRSVTNQVTKYRDESRTFAYHASQREGHYTSELRVRFDAPLDTLAPIHTSDFTESGIDHDVTHARAGVSPQRANLMTFLGFVAREQTQLRTRVLRALGDHYRRKHCAAATYTLDEAAACAFLDPKDVPQPVHAALRATLGPDEPHLMHVLGR